MDALKEWQTTDGAKKSWSGNRGRPTVGWAEGMKDAMPERGVEEGQWMDREEGRLETGRRQ
jgi:hypothetical protein